MNSPQIVHSLCSNAVVSVNKVILWRKATIHVFPSDCVSQWNIFQHSAPPRCSTWTTVLLWDQTEQVGVGDSSSPFLLIVRRRKRRNYFVVSWGGIESIASQQAIRGLCFRHNVCEWLQMNPYGCTTTEILWCLPGCRIKSEQFGT